jgi:hypothetical protein
MSHLDRVTDGIAKSGIYCAARSFPLGQGISTALCDIIEFRTHFINEPKFRGKISHSCPPPFLILPAGVFGLFEFRGYEKGFFMPRHSLEFLRAEVVSLPQQMRPKSLRTLAGD